MKRVFADTQFYLAILNESDSYRDLAVKAYADARVSHIITTAAVLLEVADGMAGVPQRQRAAAFLAELSDPPPGKSPATTIVPLSEELRLRGQALYAARPDKEWSLTDCISFVVMAEEELCDALTCDRHFEQAGFTSLMRA